MPTLAGIVLYGFTLPSITTPVGAVIWIVIIIVGISLLVALLHVLYVLACGATFVYLWIKGMFENRNRNEIK
jgi:hypothetical protein